IGLSIDVLECIARKQRKLTKLVISISAYPTNDLKTPTTFFDPERFQSLILEYSFWNYEAPGFELEKVAQYIASVASGIHSTILVDEADVFYGDTDDEDEDDLE